MANLDMKAYKKYWIMKKKGNSKETKNEAKVRN